MNLTPQFYIFEREIQGKIRTTHLAFHYFPPRAKEAPTLVWLGGFQSDMLGRKAQTLYTWAQEHGRGFLSFDYSGHGQSSGTLQEGCLTYWIEEAYALMEAQLGAEVRKRPLAPILDVRKDPTYILIGSSMGAWIALHLAKKCQKADRPPAGIVLLAPAVDFTEALLWQKLPATIQEKILLEGGVEQSNPYGDPYFISRLLIEDGRKNLLCDKIIRTYCPVHILQGMEDAEVPWRHAQNLVERISRDPSTFTLIPGGDHRLSRDSDLLLLCSVIENWGKT